MPDRADRDHERPRATLGRVASRLALLALLWWVLTGGNLGSWVVGVPTIAGATLLGLALLPMRASRLSLSGAVRFVPFFLGRSLAGGLDVALRALRPGPPISPFFLGYVFRLPQGPARVFMASVVSLLPGTLSAELEDDRVRIHALGGEPEVRENLRELERRVAGLFGLRLPPEEATGARDRG